MLYNRCLHDTHKHTCVQDTHAHRPCEAVISRISLTQRRNMSDAVPAHSSVKPIVPPTGCLPLRVQAFFWQVPVTALGTFSWKQQEKATILTQIKSYPNTYHEQAGSTAIHALITRGPRYHAGTSVSVSSPPVHVFKVTGSGVIVQPYQNSNTSFIYREYIFSLLLQ